MFWARRAGLDLLALVALPGGLAFALWLAEGVRTSCQDASGRPVAAGEPGCPAPMAYLLTHPTPWWDFNHVFGPLVLLTAVTVSLVAAAYLFTRVYSGGRRSRTTRPRVAGHV